MTDSNNYSHSWSYGAEELTSTSKSSASAQNVAFVSHSKSSTNKVKSGHTGAYSTYTPSTSSNNIPEREVPAGFADEVIYSLFAKQSEDLDLLHEDLEQMTFCLGQGHSLDECLALADLSASINLMTLSVWKKLSLPELTLTRLTLKLANRSVAVPEGVAKDVFVKVGKFYFLADFVVVDYDVDPRVPLILERPFLRMARALIDVHGEELTLRVNDEAITFKVGHISRYSHNYYDETVHITPRVLGQGVNSTEVPRMHMDYVMICTC
ncbi:reverse transcriptase domain-containing protein [Tanacetum coccineum]